MIKTPISLQDLRRSQDAINRLLLQRGNTRLGCQQSQAMSNQSNSRLL
jgi:hypothetical protein